MEWYIPLDDVAVYNILADGCHEIIYQTGACFEWQNPEPSGFAVAQFSFRTEAQMIETVEMIHALLARVKPSKAFLIMHDWTQRTPV